MNIYFIKDSFSNAVKIGKANNIKFRLSELQTGNPNILTLINQKSYMSEQESFYYESILHERYREYHIHREWFRYIPEFSKYDFSSENIHLNSNTDKQKRQCLKVNTLFGEQTLMGVDKYPRCYFYPELLAQIKDSYENSVNLKLPFRTMRFPTHGKQMLLPYSNEVDRVFISSKKHEENMELNKFLKKTNEEKSTTLESLFA